MRREFMLRGDVTFLNHGSYGAVPRCVHRRQVRYLEEMESHADVWYRFNSPEYLKTAVNRVAGFIGSSARDTFLVQNVTKAVNTVLKSFPLRPGDGILVTNLTYGAVKSIAKATAAKTPGAITHMLDITFPVASEQEIVDKYEEFLLNNPTVKMAVIDHITSPTAAVMPVKRLVEVCHKYGVIVMVDGAHAPGMLGFNLSEIDADFYTGNLHKWVYTPRSCAFLWLNPARRHAWLKPLVTSSYEDDGLELAFSYEGTKDDTAYLCSQDGIDFYNRIGGREKILAYTVQLKERGVSYLEDLWGTCRLSMPDSMVAPNLQMIALPPMPKYQHLSCEELLRVFVEKFGIQTYLWSDKDTRYVRVSTQVYNSMEDFERLGQAVLSLCSET